ncbi:MAG: NAD(P)/FAD-dependent oxidoreductase [Elusimicrobia bacterium]|nr:NAD(P)/FAD-dependent oxidoreductase [Elusimicrobiota bacterium]
MRLDCAVLGGGPAGLSAAFYLARTGLRTTVVEAGVLGGRCAALGLVSNHPAFPEGIIGRELAGRYAAQARAHGASFLAARARSVEERGGGLLVSLDGGALLARSVIVATGSEFLPLGLPEEERFRGRGLEHAPLDAAHLWRGRSVAVVGGGEAAAHQALRLAEAGATVRLWVRGADFRAVAPLRRALSCNRRVAVRTGVSVRELLGGERLGAVVLEEGGRRRREEVDALFVLVGQRPRLPGLPERAPGLFIAGDAAGLPRQTSVAAGSGIQQAMAAAAFLSS